LLTKALSKVNKAKGAPKVISLADEPSADAKGTKLPKLSSVLPSVQPGRVGEGATSSSDPELLNQLTLLDHLLRLPAEQLKPSSSRNNSGVSYADLNQPVAPPQAHGANGVSLFSSAAALREQPESSGYLPKHKDTSGSPLRRVHFAVADDGFQQAHAITGQGQEHAEEDSHRATKMKVQPTTVSPRTRAIKNSASATADPLTAPIPSSAGSKANQGKWTLSEEKPGDNMKAAYGSVRFGAKSKLAPRIPRTQQGKNPA
jgi:hypothetical protein